MFMSYKAGYTGCLLAADQIIAVGIDRKLTYCLEPEKIVRLESGRGEVLFHNLDDPGNPHSLSNLPIASSVVGPPTIIVISLHQKFALIANALTMEEL